jgi:HNH endonuclease
MAPRRRPDNERFWKFVQTSDDCWLWIGSSGRRGYGRFSIREGESFKSVQAHRFAYELLIGPIPEGLVLDHIECDNPRCVNPGHTIPATSAQNILRGTSPSALNARKTHCKNGHPFTDSNTYFYNGTRSCIICKRLGNRMWMREHYRAESIDILEPERKVRNADQSREAH